MFYPCQMHLLHFFILLNQIKNKYKIINLYGLLAILFVYIFTITELYPLSNASLVSQFFNRYTVHTGKKVSSGIH